jgi:protein-histidine N-methyltransferase
MSSQFSFSFTGEDIEDVPSTSTDPYPPSSRLTAESRKSSNTAFPIVGRAMLPAQVHDLDSLLSFLPSKIEYGSLAVTLDDGTEIDIPRRELWDVRVQLMAGSDADGGKVGLGKDDVKTGVYEGGFKSWESSVDLVKVLAARRSKEGRTARERSVLEVLHIEPLQYLVPVKGV